MSHSLQTGSYNWGPFLCPGEAAVRQLQAVHRALPVPDEEHASGFPVHQRRCHHTLRAHVEVKSHHHRITHLAPAPIFTPNKHRETTTGQSRSVEVTLLGSSQQEYYSSNILIISHCSTKKKIHEHLFLAAHAIA